MSAERCRTYVVDGEPVTVRGAQPLDLEQLDALAEIARAARARITPEMAERQDAAMRRNHERLVRLGLVPGEAV